MPQTSPKLIAKFESHRRRFVPERISSEMAEILPLWQLNIAELTGHNLEARGRQEVSRLLNEGWQLLHIYTLKYQEDGVWCERPMAILGRPGSNACCNKVKQN